jgi:hypothetical protein
MPSAAAGPFGGGNPPPTQWAAGLSPKKQHVWLVDCYRMRVDDDMVYGGDCVGLYNPESDKGDVLLHFLVFCRLAVAHGVVPRGWDWPAFLREAAKLLPFAFEKEDAKEKWGGENVFSVFMGGRSLRTTGEVVYGSSIGSLSEVHDDEMRVYQELEDRDWEELIESPDAARVFRSVGGVAAWRELHANMPVLHEFS